MTYRILDTRTRRIIVAGLSLAEAHRFVRDRPGTVYLP